MCSFSYLYHYCSQEELGKNTCHLTLKNLGKCIGLPSVRYGRVCEYPPNPAFISNAFTLKYFCACMCVFVGGWECMVGEGINFVSLTGLNTENSSF